MAFVDTLKRNNSMSDLERNTLHAVRGMLRAMNVYHSVWEISIYQKSPQVLEVTAWIPMNFTLPAGMQRPLRPIHFPHIGGPMREFTDVSFQPIARELAKEMTLAFQLGEKY